MTTDAKPDPESVEGTVRGGAAARERLDEGDIAADFLEGLLDIADLDGDFEISMKGDRPFVKVAAGEDADLESLSDPKVVEAMQHLVRLAVQARTGEYSRVILDIGGSRDVRQQQLRALVDRGIEELEGGAAAAALPPVSSYERKIIHDYATERGFDSESEGEGADRHTVLRTRRS